MSSVDTQLHAALLHVLHGVEYDVLRARVTAMSARYRAEQVDDTTPGMGDDLDCLAYAVVRMPATYRAIQSALRAAQRHVGAFATHLDLGGGTGSAAWAAASLWPDIATEIVERQPAAIRLGRRLTVATGNQTTAYADQARTGVDPAWTSADLRRWTPSRQVDLITIAYVLNELTDDARHEVIATAAASATTLVIVEPGTPRGHRRILDARNQLIESGMAIAAPCPHQSACPLVHNDWCHFAVRLPRTELHRLLKDGIRNYEDEKFSYLIATREPAQPAGSRIITRPTHAKGRVVLDLCTTAATRERTVVPKSSPNHRTARSATWGDAWDV